MRTALATALLLAISAPAPAQSSAGGSVYPEMPPGRPPVRELGAAEAASEAEMKPYEETIPGVGVRFGMTPIPGGTFQMGSPDDEPDRGDDEGPVHEVTISPFWMGVREVRWDEYTPFQFSLDKALREAGKNEATEQDRWADAVSRPTPPYVPMDFGMGTESYPAICMTQFAARHYTKWLSMKTGRIYRLPTEAEWEYACRAGTTTAYSFGDDPGALDDHAWYFDNADDSYHLAGTKKPNPWGLFDMHGNVTEWVLDGYEAGVYAARAGSTAVDPVMWPAEEYNRVVRGGSWDDDADRLRSAARRASRKGWKVQDPQLPKSIWYLTDAPFAGFRVVRPLKTPSEEKLVRCWDADLDSVREILAKQREGGR